MGSVTAAETTVDGRRARAARTRGCIVEATIALLDAGDLKPTAAAIAARAGLSVRSVFQHFADLEDLFLAVSDHQANRVAELYIGVSYDGDLAARIAAFVQYRSRLYETIAPIRRAAMIQEPFSKIVASRMDLARQLHRLDVERAFAPELTAGRERGDEHLCDAIAAAGSFVVWDELRRFAGLSVAAAADVLTRTVSAMVAGPASGH
ncbi:MAG TPA: TetR family transcriptional regulator [Candidatus Binatia bacterium]|jgi:AcrR family transcriptional regulator